MVVVNMIMVLVKWRCLDGYTVPFKHEELYIETTNADDSRVG